MKLTDHTCVCNDLTNFEYGAQVMTGNGTYVKNLSNPFRWTYFWRILVVWKPMCGATPIDLPRPLFELLWATVCPDLTKYFKKERRTNYRKVLPGTCDLYPVFSRQKHRKTKYCWYSTTSHIALEKKERYYVHFNTHRHFVIHFHVCRFDKSPAHEVLK